MLAAVKLGVGVGVIEEGETVGEFAKKVGVKEELGVGQALHDTVNVLSKQFDHVPTSATTV